MNYNLGPHYSDFNCGMGGPYGPARGFMPYDSFSQYQIPFLTPLDLPNFEKLTNETIYHDLRWKTMPSKLPFSIPKFEGKLGESPSMHITTFHLWLPSNSFMDDSIKLSLFQRNLMGDATK